MRGSSQYCEYLSFRPANPLSGPQAPRCDMTDDGGSETTDAGHQAFPGDPPPPLGPISPQMQPSSLQQVPKGLQTDPSQRVPSTASMRLAAGGQGFSTARGKGMTAAHVWCRKPRRGSSYAPGDLQQVADPLETSHYSEPSLIWYLFNIK